MMKIDSLTNQGSNPMNEDSFIIKNNLFAVFDGATSLISYLDPSGITGGKIAADTLKEIFSLGDKSFSELSLIANNTLREKMLTAKRDITKKEELWSTTISAIKLEEEEIDCFFIGDSIILAIYNDNICIIGEQIDHDKKTLLLWKELANRGIENIRETLQEQLVLIRRQANISYGQLNGEPEAKNFFQSAKISRKGLRSILVFTDGFCFPREDPNQEQDWKEFANMYLEKGLSGILSYIRNLELSDPKLWKYPRVKIHDDATAIAIDF